MSKLQSALRAVAVPAAAALFTMGAVAPTYADGAGGQHGQAGARSHSSPSATRSQGATSHRQSGHGPAHTSGRVRSSESNGGGHTPVTVCHLLGNGSYHLLTFDDNALKAHLGHGDLYPVPASGCPGAQPGAVVPVETTPLSGTAVAEVQKSVAAWNLARALSSRPATVLGVQTVRAAGQPAVLGASRTAARPAAVLGAQATGSPAAGQVAAAGGILPQTGAAAPLGMALLAGLGLVGAGAALVTRKRPANR